jgi:hypothetical protein
MCVLKFVFKSKKYNFLDRLYDILTITYGCEKWPLSLKISQLQATEMRILRKMEGETNRDRIMNQAMRMGLGIIPLKEMIEIVHFRWFGHVVRMWDDRCPKMAWQSRAQGKRPKRKPRQAWEEGIRRILKERGIEWDRERAYIEKVRDGNLCKPGIS